MFSCDVCGKHGPHRYEGHKLTLYGGIFCCDSCWASNWDGWAPHYEGVLTKHLKEKGVPVPKRNEKGWLPRNRPCAFVKPCRPQCSCKRRAPNQKEEKQMLISKLEAARQQLDTAIWLYFNSDAPVSVHTLTAAAYDVIRGVNQKTHGPKMIVKDLFAVVMKPEHRKMFFNKVNEAANFFKHADRDANDNIEFKPRQTEFLLTDAIYQYSLLAHAHTNLFLLFYVWFAFDNPHLCSLTEEQKRTFPVNADFVKGMTRSDYYSLVLPMIKANTKNDSRT